MVLSVTGMLVDLSVTIMQVAVSVAIMQLEVSAAHAGNSFCNKYMDDNFIVIMQMRVSVTIM